MWEWTSARRELPVPCHGEQGARVPLVVAARCGVLSSGRECLRDRIPGNTHRDPPLWTGNTMDHPAKRSQAALHNVAKSMAFDDGVFVRVLCVSMRVRVRALRRRWIR